MLRTTNVFASSRLSPRSLPGACALAAACIAAGCESQSWQLGQDATLTATIDDWRQPPSYHLEVGVSRPRTDGGSADFVKLTTAEIARDGSFRVALPGAAAIAPHLETWDPTAPDPSSTSKNEVRVDSPDGSPVLRVASLTFKITDGDGYQYLWTQSPPLRGEDGRVWGIDFYWVDRDVRLSGSKEGRTVSPSGVSRWKTTFDLQLAAGWNRRRADTTFETRDGQRFMDTRMHTTDEIPAEVRWSYVHGSD